MTNTITDQLTPAGRAIEHDSFAVIDAEAGPHSYTDEQWPLVRRMIHANADFEFNGLTAFRPDAMRAGMHAGQAGLGGDGAHAATSSTMLRRAKGPHASTAAAL